MGSDTPTSQIRALSDVRKEKISLLQVICALLLTSLGVVSGVVWNSLSSTVAAHSIQLADQQAKIAVLESQRIAIAEALAHIEAKLDAMAAHLGKAP